MARVKVCPSCREENAPTVSLCECGCDLSTVRLSRAGQTAAETSIRDDAGATSSPETGVAYAVRFPWGVEAVGGRLGIGRSPSFSTLASSLASYPNISSRHAEFLVRDSCLFVVDLSSTNGTVVDGLAVEPEDPRMVAPGSEVRFGADLVSVVEDLAEEDP